MLQVLKNSLLGIFLVPVAMLAQPCDFELRGTVRDNGVPLSGATIWMDSIYKGLSDADGSFLFRQVCKGERVVTVKSVGYADSQITINIPFSGQLTVELSPSSHLLHGVTILSDHEQQHGLTQTVSSISGDELQIQKGKSLGELTQGIPGITSLKTGPSIYKPVIHGLHSQRILILNNGVRQEGQQWGIEHAPEIDTYIASEIEVVKGAESVRYGADAMGGVILINPPSLFKPNAFGGELHVSVMTNSRTVSFSGLLEGKIAKHEFWNWRIQGTIKKGGDFHAPNYSLSNTGAEEIDGSAALGYRKDNKQIEIYFSSFNTQLGILRSAHTGNLNDFQTSIESGRPWYVNDFTYSIANPKQKISHQLLKLKGTFPVGERVKLNFVYGGQYNQRKEFDLRRGGRNDKPALSLNLVSHTLDVSVDHIFEKWSGSLGVSGSLKDNTNQPGLGIKPLIPDYNQYSAGLFLIEKIRKAKWLLELGARYDVQSMQIFTFDENNVLLTPQFSFQYAMSSVGASYYLNQQSRVSTNLGLSFRAPHVSELLSNGLHHSTASIEEGLLTNTGDYKSEFSRNWINTYQFINENLTVEVSAFANLIDNYIYLRPNETRLTIRGYFPVFQYHQTNAILTGANAMINWNLTKEMNYSAKVSYVFAKDLTNEDKLLFVPPTQFENSISLKKSSEKLKDLFITARVLTTLKQFRAPRTVYPEEVTSNDTDKNFDFMDAPHSYTLCTIESGKTFRLGKNEMYVAFSVENLFDTHYRNYMNRLRYYADDLGRNIMIRLRYKFTARQDKTN